MNDTPIRRLIPAAVGAVPGILHVDVSGRVLSCLSSTGKFFVRVDNGGEFEMSGGRYYGNPDAAEFGRLTLKNYTAVAVDIDCIAGDKVYKPDSSVSSINAAVTVSGKNAATYSKGSGVQVLPGPGATFLGVDGGGQLRKAFAVKNREASGSGNNIYVIASNGAVMWELAPQEGHVLECGSAISLSGVGFAYVVEEVFYA